MTSAGSDGPMRVGSRIADCLGDLGLRAAVSEVRLGLGYTAVRLADGRTGLAYTFREAGGSGCSPFRGLRPLSGRLASDLLPLIESADALEAAVGLACANALADTTGAQACEGDTLEHLDLRQEDEVAMLGHFCPLVARLQERVHSLTVFERIARPEGHLRPTSEAPEALRRCQVALITATSIINHTIDSLLESARGCREVAILGASTPLVPSAFHGTPVTLLSGVQVRDPEAVLRIVSEGGGMRWLGPHVRKVSIRLGGRGSARREDGRAGGGFSPASPPGDNRPPVHDLEEP